MTVGRKLSIGVVKPPHSPGLEQHRRTARVPRLTLSRQGSLGPNVGRGTQVLIAKFAPEDVVTGDTRLKPIRPLTEAEQ